MSVRRTSEVPIPDDLRAFLAARKQLAYEPPLLCEVGAVKVRVHRAVKTLRGIVMDLTGERTSCSANS